MMVVKNVIHAPSSLTVGPTILPITGIRPKLDLAPIQDRNF